MRWFRKPQIDPLAVSMPGVKLADRLLVLGAEDPVLIAALASKSGLTGRACVLDVSPEATAAAAAAVEREGALVEPFASPWTTFPFDAHTFDVVVIHNVLRRLQNHERLRCVEEVHRVLRPGGRAVVIEGAQRAGLAALFGSGGDVNTEYRRSGGATHALQAAGFRGVRTLAEREGQLFVEGIKAAT